MKISYWTLFIFFILFFIKGLFIDPDFGWHLVTGQFILSHGIPQTDPFSYSMPGYHLVDHEWLTDVLTAIAYPFIGLVGFAVIAALSVTGAMFLQISRKEKLLSLPLLLSGAALLPIVGFRPQVLSWFFFSALLVVMLNKKYLLRFRFGLPVFFLLWANMHGSFALGLCTVALFLFASYVQTKKISRGNFAVLILCTLVTLVNPYGFRLWQEVAVTLSQPEVHFILVEWFSAFQFPYFPIWILIVLSVILFFRYRERYSFLEKILYIFLLCVGLAGVRNTPYWVIFSLPLTVRGLQYFQNEAGKEGKERFSKVLLMFSAFALFVIVSQNIYSFEPFAYPQGAVKYLRSHMPAGNVFADFNWGGYLIWQLPEKKVFIDGRMSNWRQHTNYPQESDNAFQEYYWVANGVESIQKLTTKYNIDILVLTPIPFGSWQQRDVDLFNVNEKKKYPPIAVQLKEGGWKMVYKDSVATVYQRL